MLCYFIFYLVVFFFFFKQKTAYEMRISDWSSDVCSSDLLAVAEIEKAQADPDYRMRMSKGPDQMRRTKGPRYTPVSKRQDKPDGIAWIIRNHPEITDGQISRLIGTTKTTIAAIRDRTHWNIANITPKDPVTLGLCAQRELDALVAAAAKKAGVVIEDGKLAGDREALLEELRTQRDAAARLADETNPEAVFGIGRDD